MRKRIFRAVSSREGAAIRAAESGYRGLSTPAVTVVDAPFRDFARILHFPLANCASRRRALWGSSHGDRAERMNLNIWSSSRDSYQRREETPINRLG